MLAASADGQLFHLSRHRACEALGRKVPVKRNGIGRNCMPYKNISALAGELSQSEGYESAQASLEVLLRELRVHQSELEAQNQALRQSQLELEESRRRYVSLYEYSPIGFLTLTPTGQITEANFTAASMLRVERDQLLRQRFEMFVAPPDRERWQYQFARAMAEGHRRVTEVRLKHGDGSISHANLDCLPWVSGDALPNLRVALTDITERKLAEALMRDNEERLRLALEVSNDGFWDWNLCNDQVYLSPRCYDLIGCRPDEVTVDFALFKRIVHPDDLCQLLAAIKSHFQAGMPKSECVFRVRNLATPGKCIRGKARVVERDVSGVALRMVGTVSEITAPWITDTNAHGPCTSMLDPAVAPLDLDDLGTTSELLQRPDRGPLVLAAIRDANVRRQVLDGLPDYGYRVLGASNLMEFQRQMHEHAPQILLIDTFMADYAGPALLAHGVVQVALCEPADTGTAVQMLRELGAASCVSLPLNLDVLAGSLDGLRQLLRTPVPACSAMARMTDATENAWVLAQTSWTLKLPDGSNVRLTQTETSFLSTLAATPGVPVSRAQIIASLGHDTEYYDSRRLDTMVSRLRAKVAEKSKLSLPVRCIRAVGYAIVVPVVLDD